METKCSDLVMKRFKFFISIWRVLGLPLFKEKSKLYTVYRVIVWFLMTSFPVVVFLDSVHNAHDIIRVTHSNATALATCLADLACLTLSINQDSFETLFRITDAFTWEDMSKKDPQTGGTTMAGWIARMEKIIKYTAIISITLFSVQAYIHMSSGELSVNAWYPFEFQSSPSFELINVVQYMQHLCFTALYFGFLGTYALHLEIGCSQLEKLAANLQKIRQKNGSPEDAQIMQQQLNLCITHHQKILEYLETMERVFNSSICTSFLLLMAILCMTAFLTVLLLGNFKELQMVMHLNITCTVMLFLFCGFGTLITGKALHIAEAAYDVDWIGAPISFQRSVLIMLTQANKKFNLTAGKFVPVSNVTMMNIFSEIWSLFLFLLQVVNPEDHATTQISSA